MVGAGEEQVKKNRADHCSVWHTGFRSPLGREKIQSSGPLPHRTGDSYLPLGAQESWFKVLKMSKEELHIGHPTKAVYSESLDSSRCPNPLRLPRQPGLRAPHRPCGGPQEEGARWPWIPRGEMDWLPHTTPWNIVAPPSLSRQRTNTC